ncbi:hypothetical protein MTR67_006880 [Solanum verrucosum]|uniref:Copia protein n=1 Tax=Solanum verrucosum TaxID=315347 RepID=A0AAF0THM1_SOLVR|nr:hypothetical protein MTR67_006880 [Solanum verrucosum]
MSKKEEDELASEFQIKDLGPLRYFLGMKVARSKEGMMVSQRKCVLDQSKETGMSGRRPAEIPLDTKIKFENNEDQKSNIRYCAKAEYGSMAHGICEMIWLKKIEELRRPMTPLMKLYCANKAVISIAHNPIQYDRTKYIEVDRHFIKEKLKEGSLGFPFVLTDQQTADDFIVWLFEPRFEGLVGKLGMLDIYMPT